MKCRMQPISEPDANGKQHYRCANSPCHARAFTDVAPERVFGFGDNCRGGGLRLGDRVERALIRVGVTKQRWARWRGKTDCQPCKERQERLNRIDLHWLNTATDAHWWATRAQQAVRLALKPLRWLP